MKIVEGKGYIPSIHELTANELGYNIDDDQLSLKVDSGLVINILENLAGTTLTNAQIKTQYENNSNTNAFTDADKQKLLTLIGSHFKGTHVDEAALLLAHPTAEAGS